MVKLSDIDLPVIIKNRLLFKSGNWNRWNIEAREVQKAFERTEWDKAKTKAIYYQHRDKDSEKWTGNISNPHLINDRVYGDLEIWDAATAVKIKQGRAPFAISAKINWPTQYQQPTDFKFANFSYVADPGVAIEEMFINFSKEGDGENGASILIEQSDLEIDERGFDSSQNTMESEKSDNPKIEEVKSAEFSQADMTALFERVAVLEKQSAELTARFEAEAPVKEAEVEEIVEAPIEEVKEEVVEVKTETAEPVAAVEEVKVEEVKEEAEAEATEEKSEEVKDEVETEAEFSNEVLEQLKEIREAIGVSKIPANTAAFSDSKTGFHAAYDRFRDAFA